ncbi:MAG TPA: type 1 glutamine amidotransferase [Bacteroidales bacterium]|jgi:GMP synthase (glutamine-hydrolysing)|nr:type 1 glutamine amidotransferase [Bacteroidales bacterium]
MHLHYFQHDDYEDLAYIREWAQNKGFTTSCTRLDRADPKLPSHGDYDWLIILGGAVGAYEEALYPWLIEEKKFIREAIREGKLVLGICLGSQLIASSLGADVYPNSAPEIGYFPVYFNQNAKQDDLYSLLPDELTVMHWHNDTFNLPEGAVCMASSARTRNQAFRWGKNVFALQFHFELTEMSANTLIDKSGKNLQISESVQPAEVIRSKNYVTLENNRLFGQFLDKLLTI